MKVNRASVCTTFNKESKDHDSLSFCGAVRIQKTIPVNNFFATLTSSGANFNLGRRECDLCTDVVGHSLNFSLQECQRLDLLFRSRNLHLTAVAKYRPSTSLKQAFTRQLGTQSAAVIAPQTTKYIYIILLNLNNTLN